MANFGLCTSWPYWINTFEWHPNEIWIQWDFSFPGKSTIRIRKKIKPQKFGILKQFFVMLFSSYWWRKMCTHRERDIYKHKHENLSGFEKQMGNLCKPNSNNKTATANIEMGKSGSNIVCANRLVGVYFSRSMYMKCTDCATKASKIKIGNEWGICSW